MTTPDEAAQRRALLLFEQFGDRPADCERAVADEPPEVITELRRLEAIAPRARSAFPTEEDRALRPAPVPLPTAVGAYRLKELLGEGGMGIVFAAERDDGLFEHHVAIKLIRPGRHSALDATRFGREMRLLAKLDHPGIARLIDGGITACGWPYIVMEKIEGTTILDHVVAQAPAPVDRVGLLLAVCDAVQAAHRALIAHGDIKPDNIIVAHRGWPKLLDFGVAQLLDGDPGVDMEPRTIAYAAPERRAGGPPTVAADIYAIGVLIRSLFGNGDAGLPQAMSIRNRDLMAIASRANAEDPAERYPGVEGLAADLRRWRDRRPVQARPLTPRYATERFIARHKIGVAAGTAGIIAIAAMLLYAILGWHEAQRRVADLRAITRFQLTELDHRLSALPRTVALRAQLARQAQAYLERISSSPESDAALRIEAADGFRRLALLQGAADRPSLGDMASARQSFARADALLWHVGGEGAARLRASAAIDRAKLEAAALNTDAAQRLLARIEQSSLTGDAALAARFLLVRSEVEQWQGALRQSAGTARQARSALGARQDPEAILLRARALEAEAEALYYDRATRIAYERYGQAHRLLEGASRRWPRDRAIAWARNLSRWELGTTALELGNVERARTLLELYWREANAEAAADPADAISARRRRTAMTAFGQALVASGVEGEGLALLRASVRERQRWWQRVPEDRARARDWYIALAALGDALITAGQPAKACEQYARARRVVDQASRRARLPALDEVNSLAELDAMGAIHCAKPGHRQLGA